MPAPLIAAVAAPVVGAIAGKALGPKQQKTEAQVPKDLQGMRSQQIGLLQYLTGFGPAPAGLNLGNGPPGTAPPQGQQPQGRPQGQIPTMSAPQGGGNSPWMGSGGQIPIMQGFQGGNAMHFAQGGVVPDTVPAMLTPGETVMNNGASDAVGRDLLMLLNQMGQQQPQHFAAGGVVQNLDPMVNMGGMPSNMPPVSQGFPQNIQPGVPNIGPNGPSGFPEAPQGGQAGMGGPQAGFQPPRGQGAGIAQPANAQGAAGNQLQSYFGQLGVQQNPLQNSAANAANRMLTQQSPEQRALEQMQPYVGQTGINQNAQNRLTQGMSQSGLNGGAQNYLQGVVQNGAGNLGPGQQATNTLTGLSQNGGFNPNSQIMQQLQQMGSGQMAGGGSGADAFLQKMLAQNPGQANMDLLQPQFERSLNQANQTGGRFGSANALMRSNAVTDQQAQLAQMLGQGTGQQLQAAGQIGQNAQANRSMTLQSQLQALGLGTNAMGQAAQNQLGAANSLGGFNQQGALAGLQARMGGANSLNQFGLQDQSQQLGAAAQVGQQGLQGFQNLLQGLGMQGQAAGQAGNAERANIGQAFGMGSQLAQQGDVENQRRIQLLLGMLGQSQGAAFNVPQSTTPSGAQQGAALGGQIGNTVASYYGNQGR